MLGKSSDSCVGRRDASQLDGMEDSRRRRLHLAVLLCGLVLLTFTERRLAELDFNSTGVVRIENNDKPDGDEIIKRLVFVDDAIEPIAPRASDTCRPAAISLESSACSLTTVRLSETRAPPLRRLAPSVVSLRRKAESLGSQSEKRSNIRGGTYA